MDNDVVLKLEGVSKKFCRSLKRSLFYGTVDSFKNMMMINTNQNKLRKSEFWALKDINLELRKGEVLGLIGQNGCGKTTLLRLINGIFPPDTGKITIKGRIGALIAVGAGFHPHMSGRENIYLNGTILGMTRKEIDSKFESIVDFSEIGDFLDAPVSTYSSGMHVRLGFSIAIHSTPDILLIDEILAVGDMKFHQKCFSKISELMKNDVAIIFVSHNIEMIQRICKKGLILKKGVTFNYGNVEDVISDYYEDNNINPLNGTTIKPDDISYHGISYNYVKFLNSKGIETRDFLSGEDIIVIANFNTPSILSNITISIGLRRDEFTFNGYSSSYDNVIIEELSKRTIIKLRIKKPYLQSGNYRISIGLFDKDFIGCYYWDWETVGRIKINNPIKMLGRFQFDHEWEIES